MEDMSRHVIISLILLVTLIFLLLLSSRIYTNRRARLRNSQLQEASQTALPPPQTTATATTIPLGWHRAQGTLTQSPGTGLRFTPSPHSRGDVVVNIPIGVQFWNGRESVSRSQTRQNSSRHMDWADDTPSVWGIDLGRRGASGGLRAGAAVLVPPPGAVVVTSTTRVPGMVGMWGGRRGVQEDVAMEEGEGLPRYEEPPPGYEKVLAEGGTRAVDLPGEAAEGSDSTTLRESAARSAAGVDGQTIPVPDSPRAPDPLVTRDRPGT